MLVPMSSNWKGGKWKAMEWEKGRKEWEGEALLGEEADETWGDRQAWEKGTGSQQQGRKEEVTRLTLQASLYFQSSTLFTCILVIELFFFLKSLLLDDRTWPIFTVLFF